MDEVEAAAEPLRCRSVGWLATKTKECVVLVPHIAGEASGAIILQGCGDLTIPTKSITKTTVLRKR